MPTSKQMTVHELYWRAFHKKWKLNSLPTTIWLLPQTYLSESWLWVKWSSPYRDLITGQWPGFMGVQCASACDQSKRWGIDPLCHRDNITATHFILKRTPSYIHIVGKKITATVLLFQLRRWEPFTLKTHQRLVPTFVGKSTTWCINEWLLQLHQWAL